MELKRLKHLVALADERNFGRAAASVHLSQPAFSRSVQAAETELGMQLFERGNADVSCTPAGAFVIERARKLVQESRRLTREVGLYRDRAMGDIALGVGPFASSTLLPALMIDMRQRYPHVSARVQVNNSAYLVGQLRQEVIDFFVADTRDVPRDANFNIAPIGRQRGRLYVRAGHPLLARPLSSLADVALYGLATGRLPAQPGAALRTLMGRAEDEGLPVAIECDDIHLLKLITEATDTVMVSSEAIMRQDLAAGRFCMLELVNFPQMFSEMGIVSLRGRSHSPMAQYAVEFLTRLAAEQDVYSHSAQ
jgi:DNA-binding transcriptional LysR family regulator